MRLLPGAGHGKGPIPQRYELLLPPRFVQQLGASFRFYFEQSTRFCNNIALPASRAVTHRCFAAQRTAESGVANVTHLTLVYHNSQQLKREASSPRRK